MSDAFGPLEDAFFAAGDAYEHREDSGSDQDVHFENEPQVGWSASARLGTALTAARTRVMLRARLVELRFAVAVSNCAELALYATVFRVAGARPVGTRVHTFIPRLTRNPVLVRVSLIVLGFTAATFPAAAVLAATGAI
jgi:hypothetical protein